MSQSGLVYLDVKLILRETAGAFLFVLDDDDEEVWVPKAVVANADNLEAGDQNCTAEIFPNFAADKGWE